MLEKNILSNVVAAKSWPNIKVDTHILNSVSYLPITNKAITSIKILATDEIMVDLAQITNPRLQALAKFDPIYQNDFPEYSQVRTGIYERLRLMLEILPANVGIAYFEGLRPLSIQKKYFDKKFLETLAIIKEPDIAYAQTCISVSPYINNIPVHSTGAAIDIHLFTINTNGTKELLDLGKFDTIFGDNLQQQTFAENLSQKQQNNRLLLLNATAKAGLINYGYEWWHYSYGDKVWAHVTNAPHAFYDIYPGPDLDILKITYADFMASMSKTTI